MVESGDYSEEVESVRVLRNFPDEYLKMVESVSVPKNCRIRVSTGKGRIRTSTEKLSG